MRSFIALMPAVLLIPALSGCLYIHTVQPLTTDMHNTPVGNVEKTDSLKVIAFPTPSGSQPFIAWDKAAIGEVAKKEGMNEVYFADVERFSILTIWNKYTIHVYGK